MTGTPNIHLGNFQPILSTPRSAAGWYFEKFISRNFSGAASVERVTGWCGGAWEVTPAASSDNKGHQYACPAIRRME